MRSTATDRADGGFTPSRGSEAGRAAFEVDVHYVVSRQKDALLVVEAIGTLMGQRQRRDAPDSILTR